VTILHTQSHAEHMHKYYDFIIKLSNQLPTVGPLVSGLGFLVLHFQVLHLPPLTFAPTFSGPTFSTCDIWSCIFSPTFSVL